jgi:hypothetical protein
VWVKVSPSTTTRDLRDLRGRRHRRAPRQLPADLLGLLPRVAESLTVRCIAPRKRLRFDGDTCHGFVASLPTWMAPELLGLLAHSDLRREPDTITAPCARCGYVHEIALRGVAIINLAA